MASNDLKFEKRRNPAIVYDTPEMYEDLLKTMTQISSILDAYTNEQKLNFKVIHANGGIELFQPLPQISEIYRKEGYIGVSYTE